MGWFPNIGQDSVSIVDQMWKSALRIGGNAVCENVCWSGGVPTLPHMSVEATPPSPAPFPLLDPWETDKICEPRASSCPRHSLRRRPHLGSLVHSPPPPSTARRTARPPMARWWGETQGKASLLPEASTNAPPFRPFPPLPFDTSEGQSVMAAARKVIKINRP